MIRFFAWSTALVMVCILGYNSDQEEARGECHCGCIGFELEAPLTLVDSEPRRGSCFGVGLFCGEEYGHDGWVMGLGRRRLFGAWRGWCMAGWSWSSAEASGGMGK